MSLDVPWFVTWSTYGTWLPGDPRGFQTRRGREYVPPPRRYAHPGEKAYDPDDYQDRHAMASELSKGAVYLTPQQQRVARALRPSADSPLAAAMIAAAAVFTLARTGSRSSRA